MKFIAHTAYNVKRELRMIFRDPGAILILCLAMIIYPLVYSSAYSGEVLRESRLAVADLDHSQASRALIRMACATEQLQKARPVASVEEAQQMFFRGEADAVLLVPEGFEENILAGRAAPVKLYADASYMLSYKQAYSGLLNAAGTMGAGIEVKRLLAQGNGWETAQDKQNPVSARVYQLNNPSSGYASSIMPGMILLIMQQTLLIGIGLVGGSFRERGSHKPNSIGEVWRGGILPIVIGKSLAYLLLYLFNSVLALLIIFGMFDFPDKGGFMHGLVILVPFFLSVIFMGISVSLIFTRRINSLLFLVFLSPIVLFVSGVSWPVQALPEWLQYLAQIFPSSYAIPAYIRLRIQGVGWDAVSADYARLMIQMLIYFGIALWTHSIAYRRYHRQEDLPSKI